MKNKEIAEMIQNRIEDIYQSGEYIYQAKELEEILSYIEQLENNRDKAIKFIEEKRKVFEWYDTDLFYLESLLKGGSDE